MANLWYLILSIFAAILSSLGELLKRNYFNTIRVPRTKTDCTERFDPDPRNRPGPEKILKISDQFGPVGPQIWQSVDP